MGARSSWRANLLIGAFWLIGLYGVGYAFSGVLKDPGVMHGVMGVTAAFLVMSVVFAFLRVPTGKGEVSVAALVSFLTIAVLGPWPAVGIKLVSSVISGSVRQSASFRTRRDLFINSGIFSVTVLLAGLAYSGTLAGLGYTGTLSGLGYTGIGMPMVVQNLGAANVLAFLAMAIVYTPANILLIAVVRWLRTSEPLGGFIVDRLKRLWVNAVLFAAVGLIGEVIYAQLGLAGLLVVFALLLAVRFTFRIYGEAQHFRSEMADALAQVLAFKDPYTGAHSARVADLSVRIGEQLGLSDMQKEKLRDSALLHDIGKVAVPDSVLVKPGPLDAGEWQTMSRHVGVGGEILEQSPHLRELAGYVRGHHSDFDDRETGGRSPLEARIIAVADAYDAMTSDRPYRPALPQAEATRRLLQASGSQFDPRVVQALLRALEEAHGPRADAGQAQVAAASEQASNPEPPRR